MENFPQLANWLRRIFVTVVTNLASEGRLGELRQNLDEVKLWTIGHNLTLSALLGLVGNCPEVAGNSGQLPGNQLRKNFCEVAWERSLCELRHHGDEVSPRPRE